MNYQPAQNILRELLSEKYKEDTGWLKLPYQSRETIEEINLLSEKIRKQSDVLIVVGVGGSYLGSKAVIEALSNKYNREIEIMYLGNSLSSLDLKESLDYLHNNNKDFTVNLISKSGTTLEPSVAFRVLRELLIARYGHEAAMDRIVITTGEGKLRDYADRNGIRTLAVPDDIGGRYSVLTPVGLLPIRVAGLDIQRLISGARSSLMGIEEGEDNLAVKYASNRVNMYKRGYKIEVFAYYEPRLHYFVEWWKQLFGESEGKDGKGIFPAGACFTKDLHSLGQLIQDGERNIFETHLTFSTSDFLSFGESEENFDDLNYLSNVNIETMNRLAKDGTMMAHRAGGVPSLELDLDVGMDEFGLGYLIHTLQTACAISAILTGVNPFNQPGVESYKTELKRLLKDKTDR